MILILAILFICAAAGCKALADTLRDHFYISIFRKRDPKFWNPSVSWQYAKTLRFTKYRVDAWHLCNSLMIAFFDAAIVCVTALKYGWKWYWFTLEFGLIGVVFILSFNLFYNKILQV